MGRRHHARPRPVLHTKSGIATPETGDSASLGDLSPTGKGIPLARGAQPAESPNDPPVAPPLARVGSPSCGRSAPQITLSGKTTPSKGRFSPPPSGPFSMPMPSARALLGHSVARRRSFGSAGRQRHAGPGDSARKILWESGLQAVRPPCGWGAVSRPCPCRRNALCRETFGRAGGGVRRPSPNAGSPRSERGEPCRRTQAAPSPNAVHGSSARRVRLAPGGRECGHYEPSQARSQTRCQPHAQARRMGPEDCDAPPCGMDIPGPPGPGGLAPRRAGRSAPIPGRKCPTRWESPRYA